MSYLPQTKGDRALVVGAAAVFALAFRILWFYEPMSHGPGSAVMVGSVSTNSAIRRRHAGTLAWSAIEKQGEIYFRDIVYTPAGTLATVTLKNGKVVPLPPDSLVQFDEVTVANIEIALRETAKKKDVFRLLPMPKTAQNRLLPDPLSLELLFEDLENRMKAQMNQPQKPMVVVKSPKLEFKLDTLADFQVKLALPRDRGVYNLQRDSWFTMSWSAVPLENVKYILEIARNPEFRKKLPFTAEGNNLQVQLQNPGAYYWRVRAVLKDQVLTSETRTFEMSLRGGATDLLSKVQLPKAQVQGYITEISRDSDFNQILETDLSPQPVCNLRKPVGQKTYHCRVKDARTGKPVKRYTFSPKATRKLAGKRKG
jgi:hypothetical protein